MAKWKLFGKSKSKEDEIKKPEETTEEPEEIPEEPEETIEDTEEITEEEKELDDDQPLDEYSETLESDVPSSKKAETAKSSDQRVWRDVRSIEEKVDNLHITRAQKPDNELDKTVDKLISKKKKK
jgi:hypothetical protein